MQPSDSSSPCDAGQNPLLCLIGQIADLSSAIRDLVQAQAETNEMLAEIVAHNADLADALAADEDGGEEAGQYDLAGNRVTVR
jgi:hypothetical protein